MTQLQHIQVVLKNRIDFFYSKRNQNRRMTVLFAMASASLSAAATITIASAKLLDLTWLIIAAMGATSLVTVLGVYESIFSHRRLWSINNEALVSLEKLQREIEFRLLDPRAIEPKETDAYFERLECALSNADKAWVKTYDAKR